MFGRWRWRLSPFRDGRLDRDCGRDTAEEAMRQEGRAEWIGECHRARRSIAIDGPGGGDFGVVYVLARVARPCPLASSSGRIGTKDEDGDEGMADSVHDKAALLTTTPMQNADISSG